VPNYEDEFTTQPLFNNSLDEDDSVEFEDDSVECGEQEVSWQDLECWGDVLARENVYRRFPHLSTQAAGLAVQEPEHSVFPHDDKINDKVALWVGGIAQLRVDAVVLASAASILDPSETDFIRRSDEPEPRGAVMSSDPRVKARHAICVQVTNATQLESALAHVWRTAHEHGYVYE